MARTIDDYTKEECEVEIKRLTRLVHLKGLRVVVKQLKKEAGE